MPGSPSITPAAFALGCQTIRRFEGFRAAPYQDTTGVWTVGYGMTTLPDGSAVTADTPPLTSQQGIAMQVAKLQADYAPGVEAACRGAVLLDPAWAALLSFAWNLGDARLETSGVGSLVIKGNLPAAATRMRAYNRAGGKVLPGLVTRRNVEAGMLLGKTLASQPPIPARSPPRTPTVPVHAPPAAPQPTADDLMGAELTRLDDG